MERMNFRMRLARLAVPGFADDMPMLNDHGANHGIGAGAPFPFCREGKGSLHEGDI
jgi:hypothetical protein